jgi:hypothetical protein
MFVALSLGAGGTFFPIFTVGTLGRLVALIGRDTIAVFVSDQSGLTFAPWLTVVVAHFRGAAAQMAAWTAKGLVAFKAAHVPLFTFAAFFRLTFCHWNTGSMSSCVWEKIPSIAWVTYAHGRTGAHHVASFTDSKTAFSFTAVGLSWSTIGPVFVAGTLTRTLILFNTFAGVVVADKTRKTLTAVDLGMATWSS